MGIPNSTRALFLAAAGQATGYEISRSLRFNSADSAYLSRTPASAGNRKTWTWSGWVKRGTLGSKGWLLTAGYASAPWFVFGFESSSNADELAVSTSAGVDGSGFNVTNAVFRDPSAWYHILLAFDTTQATATDRIKIYVNNTLQSLATSNPPALNADLQVNNTVAHAVGGYSGEYFNGYLADVHLVDGQALTPSSFTEVSATTGQLIPKAYTGSFGTNGFWLKFSDNSNNTAATLGKDYSGNGHNWTPFNMTVAAAPTIQNADGGLPILNTTGDYGETAASGTRADSNNAFIALAVPMNGANDGTSFSDLSATIRGSGTNKTLTVIGATTKTNTFKFYGSCGAFNPGSYYSIPLTHTIVTSSSTDFAFGTGDFTIESWVNPGYNDFRKNLLTTEGASGTGFIAGFGSYYNNATPIFSDSTGFSYSAGPNILGSWSHVAYVRQSGILYIYVNGILRGSTACSSNYTTTVAYIGNNGYANDNTSIAGYIQDLRVYKGIAKYTQDFSIPSRFEEFQASFADIDSVVDSPFISDPNGNHCTLNPLHTVRPQYGISNGNLDGTSYNISSAAYGNIALPLTGKWFYESIIKSSGSCGYATDGVTSPGSTARILYQSNGQKNIDNVTTAYGAAFGYGDVIGVAVDVDNNSVEFYKNGISQGVISYTFNDKQMYPYIGVGQFSTISVNFGQRQHVYAPPTGFLSLHTGNLPAPVVAQPSTVMDVKLYTGNGSTQTISGLGFSPDLVWLKSRNQGTYRHRLYDTVRGALNYLNSELTAAESTNQAGTLTSFNSDGFSLGNEFDNKLNDTYVAWNWDAGTTTASNPDGSITSQVRANASAGFSIVSYTGTAVAGTIGHGLNVAPSLIIGKTRDSSAAWPVYHSAIGKDGVLELNNTGATISFSNYWGTGGVTSTVFGVAGGGVGINLSGQKQIAYCFAPVAGYSSSFSITGNGSTDGPFCFLGFRPRLILLKRTDATGDWYLWDTARNPYNLTNLGLLANSSGSELTLVNAVLDANSNGFKIRGADAGVNASGGTYVGFAWAESPFQYARAR